MVPLRQRNEPLRFLIHDRDAKFNGRFDEVFGTDDIEVIEIPIRAPKGGRDRGERWIRMAPEEC